MHSPEYYSDLIEKNLTGISYPQHPDGLYAPIRYTLEGGGKRLRPMLLLAAADAYGLAPEKAIPQAVGIEMFHNFTQLHDDVMDNASVRRGRPTVHRRWNQSVAILSGDAMLTMATQYVSDASSEKAHDVLKLFNKTAMEVYEGQQYDMDFENRQKVTVVEYMRMIELKTSVLLAGAAMIGAQLGGASEADSRKLYKFAVELGLAFQLQDDLLDSYGDERLGKPIGGDILEGKKTYLMITAMSRAGEADREILRSTHTDPVLTREEKIARVREVYDRLEIPRLTEQQISLRFERALALLDTLNLEPARTAGLKAFAEGLMNRKK